MLKTENPLHKRDFMLLLSLVELNCPTRILNYASQIKKVSQRWRGSGWKILSDRGHGIQMSNEK